MTPEQKDLLIKVLSSKLPYGIKVEYEGNIFDIDYISAKYGELKLDDYRYNYTIDVGDVKPYLFPLSSMTEEQKTAHNFLKHSAYANPIKLIDWYNKNKFDDLGLIPMGLANDSTGLNIY